MLNQLGATMFKTNSKLGLEIDKNSSEQISNQLLSPKQLSKKLGVTVQTLINWRKSGELRARSIGRRIYFLWSEVIEDLKMNGGRK